MTAANKQPINVPPTYIKKYNRYVDSVFTRINKVLKKNYDPVNVRLETAPPTKKKKPSSSGGGNKNTANKTKKKPSSTAKQETTFERLVKQV